MAYYTELWRQLVPLYGENEAKAIAKLVFEVAFNLSFTDILCNKDTQLSKEQQHNLQKITEQLLTGEPVQYVLQQAWFAGSWFKVHSGVLIPRPETEDLCYWIAEQPTFSSLSNPKILDIGTGSGCIAITLSQLIKNAQTTAWDIAPEALSLAKENAKAMNVSLEVIEQDALNAPCDNEKWNIIVSNPPYITPKEQNEMEANVLQFEPDCALFVPENNPLIFYKAITHYAQKALVQGGALFFEINPLFVSEMKSLLAESGFTDIEVLIDRFGKERHVKGVKK